MLLLACGNVEHRGQWYVFNVGESYRLARRRESLGYRGKYRLTDKFHQAIGEDRIIVEDRATIVVAGDVIRGDYRDHAGRGAHRVEIDFADSRVRFAAEAERDIQRPRELGDIVDISRIARHVQGCGFMRNRRSRGGLPGLLTRALLHQAPTAKTLTAALSSAWPGRVSR